ncbi:DUF4175 domain-containing protein [Halocynthiibacter namhaensis]|uniref:DUF4175 domain-containing protein n=1 Tax=Halocynthiibacter namhaensis TaxID=1290553 RepID=UPI0005796E2A|nr:DUF4175 domain-containing protein [Halocynthiibacter namhaensis]
MTRHRSDNQWETPRLKRQIFLTHLGLIAEALCQAFWPLWVVLALVFAVIISGLSLEISDDLLRICAVCAGILSLMALGFGLWRISIPRRLDARARLDKTLAGQPLATLADQQGMGGDDPASRAIWQAHLARMQTQAAKARAPVPDLKLARRDPYALRYTGLLALLVAGMFGSITQVATVTSGLSGREAGQGGIGPQWEGWIEPPAYTGLPVLYLNDLIGQNISTPVGSRISLRFYGEPGTLALKHTLDTTVPETPDGTTIDMSPELNVTRSGLLEIEGAEDARWVIAVLPDRVPAVMLSGDLEIEASGLMSQDFDIKDDYGIIAGQVEFTLDEALLSRRFGLEMAPDPRAPLILDLPIPVSGDRAEFTETLIENLSEHAWSGLPVQMVLSVTDAQGQIGTSMPERLPLPGRRFFDPLARAVIEMRRDILWARANAQQTAQVIRAVTHRPDGLFDDSSSYLMLRTVLRRLEAEPLTAEAQTELAAALWDIALLIEDGSLSDALERMRQAQERLTQAMRDGATDQEIQQLMNALRDATQDYLRQLAQNPEDSTDEPQSGETQQLSQADIQEMMDRIQELMEQGRMAEAQELLNELSQMMENMRVTKGGGGEGQSPGEQAMDELGESIEEQQGLSDQAFRDLQEQFNPNAQAGQSGENEGRDGSQGRGQQHSEDSGAAQGDDQSEGRTDGGQGQGETSREQNLASRQQALRNELERQQGNLPGAGTEEGDAARQALDQAGDAMTRAEEKLREGGLAGALEDQADAMEQMREGMRQLGEAIAENQGQSGEEGENDADSQMTRQDPLGRTQNPRSGVAGTGDDLLQGEDLYRRAYELLQQLRERSSDPTRPDLERDYLERLLDRF